MKQFKVYYQIHDGREEYLIYFLYTVAEAKRALKKLIPEAHITRVEEL